MDAVTGNARANLPICADHLANGFQACILEPHNIASTSPVHSGNNSISVSASIGQGIAFHQTVFNTSIRTHLTFTANDGPVGGQALPGRSRLAPLTNPASIYRQSPHLAAIYHSADGAQRQQN